MTAPAAPAAAPKGRLGNGQLRRQVAEYLADHPGPCKTGEIAKALDRSAGAVGNALTTLAGNGEADLVPGKPIRYQANSATAAAAAAIAPRAPLPPKPAPAPTPAPAPAAPAPVPSPAPSLPYPQAGCGRPGHPPERAGLPAPRPGRHARCRGPAQAARRRGAGPAVRAARYRQDQPDRGGLPRPDHRRRRRRHHGRGPGRRVHPEPRRHLHLRIRAADQGHAGGAGPLHRRRDPDLAGGAGGRLPRDGRPARDHRQGPQGRGDHRRRRLLRQSAGHNPGVHGAILTEALSSRFSVQVRVTTDFDLAHALKIDPRAIRAAKDLAARQASGEIGWAPQLRELLAYAKVAGILGEAAAIANLAGIAPEEDRDVVADAVARAFARKAVAPLALGRQI